MGGSEDQGVAMDGGNSVTRPAAASDWKQSGVRVVSKDVNVTV
jgi:hypothetical protein